MIPGNLDLTENLDFRAIKPRSKSSSNKPVPWNNQSSLESVTKKEMWDIVYRYSNTSRINYSYRVTINNDDDEPTSSGFISSYVNQYLMEDIQYTIYEDSTLITNSQTLYIDYQDNYWTSSNASYEPPKMVSYKVNVIEDTDRDRCSIPWKKRLKSVYQVIDNIKSIPWDIPRIHRSFGRRNLDKLIPWKVCDKSDITFERCFDVDGRVPWLEQMNLVVKTKLHNVDRFHRMPFIDSEEGMRFRVPWLENLSYYEFSAHMDELNDIDQSSYLTNLGHLSITDYSNHVVNENTYDVDNINDILISI